MYMKTFLIIPQNQLKKDHADVNFEFYVSRRSKFVHMDLDIPLKKIANSEEIVAFIKKFWMDKKKDDRFKFINPSLIFSAKWKFDYIIFEKNYDYKQ